MQLSPTEALKIIPVSADTLYKDMKRGKLSFIRKGARKRLIDVAELERVYGPLQMAPDALAARSDNDDIRSDIRSDIRRVGGESPVLAGELALLKQQLHILEEERKREREQMQEQIEHLQATLKSAQEQQTRLTALLTDQRSDAERRAAAEQAQTLKELKAAHMRLRRELLALQERKGFLAWFGVGQGKAERAPRNGQARS